MRQKRIWTVALMLALGLALMPPARPAQAAIYIVTSHLDGDDGVCNSTHCSLREAINAANIHPGPNTINFNIPWGCQFDGEVCNVLSDSPLPTLSGGGITIDGYSQPGALPATEDTPATLKIVIMPRSAPSDWPGFEITSANNVIRGLIIVWFGEQGVVINGSGATGNTISGNHIGADVTGSFDLGNAGDGVFISGGARNNTVGGVTPAERNVISGNDRYGIEISDSGTTGNTVSGNYIGANISGTAVLSNTLGGVYITHMAQNNTIGGLNATPGGSCSGECNLISGNGRDNIHGHGVEIEGSSTMSNTVSGNTIGTDANGTADLGNSYAGVFIVDAQNNTIGGDTPGERNVISGNACGVQIDAARNNIVSGNYIGTNASGTANLGNTTSGVYLQYAGYNIIGGDTAGERNVISGNNGDGVEIYSARDNIVSGNFIGLAANGTTDLGNTGNGVYIWYDGWDDAQNNTIGGDTQGERNVISGNNDYGVRISGSGAMSNTVSGNYIGTDETGTADRGNTLNGVYIGGGARYNTVGGDTASERNVISGNTGGVWISGSGTTYNTVSRNYIGTNATGTAGLANAMHGVYISDGAQNNTVGPDNLIAYNDLNGVRVNGSTTTNNTITHNSIYSNSMGINLVSGANGDIAAPVIVTTTQGSVNVVGTACANCTVEVFENSNTDGEGETYVGSSFASAGGAFTVTVSSLSKAYLTATASRTISGTSEFSAVFTATVPLAPGSGSVYLPIILKSD